MGISTITDYSYYEAGPDGRTNAPGYRALLGLEDEQAVPMIQLKWEPSWLLFSTRTSSPQYPDAFQEQRAFYYQDLRNRYDRHWTMLADEENFQVDDDGAGIIQLRTTLEFRSRKYLALIPTLIEQRALLDPKMEVLREFDDLHGQPFETHVISESRS
ncbi:MAG: hypothetical protein IPH63_07910 [Flavobacteriales bacterium]|nr:hypothetical protein [Flavobacteriales bacterium]